MKYLKKFESFGTDSNVPTKQELDSAADKVAKDPKVQAELKEVLDKLSPEEINKLQKDINLTISNLEAQAQHEPKMQEAMFSQDKVASAGEAVEDVASGLAGTLLVPIIPVAIGAAVGSVAAGFGIVALGICGLYGIAKLLKDYANK